MMPATVAAVWLELVDPPRARAERREDPYAPARTEKRLPARRSLPWIVALVSLAAAVALGVTRPAGPSGRVPHLEGRLASARAELASANDRLDTLSTTASELQARVSGLETELRQAEASRIRTVVKTKTVTKTVPRWVPDGKLISVEVTGFEGSIGIHDVQLTHAYGYTDLVGIAVNRSGRAIAYAQLGCTFLDAQGRVLANEITNKQNWAPGATWGFVCSGQTDASGGILRVDEMG